MSLVQFQPWAPVFSETELILNVDSSALAGVLRKSLVRDPRSTTSSGRFPSPSEIFSAASINRESSAAE